MIKKNIYTIGVLVLTATSGFSQVRVGNQVEIAVTDQNPFLDVSNYNLYDRDRGRGLYFPRTDLTTFKFITDRLDGVDTFLTAFDGMVVYNTTSGQTGADAATQGVQVDVEPGFYYFYNPDSKNQGGTSVAEGKWIRIGDKASSSKAVDYKLGDAKPTGEFFWPDDQEANKKPVMRKTIEVQFNDATYTDVTGLVPETAVFIKTQLVDKATGKLLLASAEFKPNGGDEFGVVPNTNDFFVAKYGEMSTTLNGTYTMILEYYVP